VELARWYGDTKRLPCNECTELYEAAGQSTPCGECYPGVHGYNVPVLDLYNLVGDQYIMGPAGPVGINLLAVGYALDNLCEADNKLYFVERLKRFANAKVARMIEGVDDGKAGS